VRKRKLGGIRSSISSEVASSTQSPVQSRQFREGLTRVGIITSPIKGKNTNAMQWGRWTP